MVKDGQHPQEIAFNYVVDRVGEVPQVDAPGVAPEGGVGKRDC